MGGPGTLQETWGKCKDSDWGVEGTDEWRC